MDYSNHKTTEGVENTTHSYKSNGSDNEDFWVNETVSLLALSLVHGVGYWTLRSLALRGLGFKQVLQAGSTGEFINYLVQSGCKATNHLESQIEKNWIKFREDLWDKAVELYRQLKAEGIEIIHSQQEIFPQSLRAIAEPPGWLFVQGNLSILHQPALAIVGTRHPSEDGIFLANYVGACLQYFNAVTVSGLALGIDQIIHRKSIRAKIPTIAVIGTGILQNYPTGSERLRQEICKNGGAIVSEYLPYQSYSAENFVHRNRLQAGLSDVVLPVEWKEKGGTSHTVKFADKAKKRIVCLKLPDWSDSHGELSLAKKLGANIFTIPGDEKIFISTINDILIKQQVQELEYKQQAKANNLEKSIKEKEDGYKQMTLFDHF